MICMAQHIPGCALHPSARSTLSPPASSRCHRVFLAPRLLRVNRCSSGRLKACAKFDRWVNQGLPNAVTGTHSEHALLLSINRERPEGVPGPFGAVIERYLARELPERDSTASRYQSWLKNYVKPTWAECLLDQI